MTIMTYMRAIARDVMTWSVIVGHDCEPVKTVESNDAAWRQTRVSQKTCGQIPEGKGQFRGTCNRNPLDSTSNGPVRSGPGPSQ